MAKRIPDGLREWKLLTQQAKTLFNQRCSDFRQRQNIVHTSGIWVNYSHQCLTKEILSLLFSLSESCFLKRKIEALMNGEYVNIGEKKPALHTALRIMNSDDSIMIDGRNIVDDIMQIREKMYCVAEQIRTSNWLGFSGEPITDIVNIGIGGSDLGPRFCLRAFSNLLMPKLRYHFISDADPCVFNDIIEPLRPETTLFIIASKSFITQETLYNARKAKAWIGEAHLERHFIAVTAEEEKAKAFGIKTILPIWSWIGGRYSLCSAINLITAIAIGPLAFSELLAGANSMDEHFRHASFDANLPVLLGLIGVWNNNFLASRNLLMLTYSKYLDQFVPYVQQLDMESNGKSTDHRHRKVSFSTGPIIWGGPGNQAQHSYYQLLCQGTHKVAVDFLTIQMFNDNMINQMCFDKIQVLSEGVKSENFKRCIDGKVPLSHIEIKDNSPFTIGALIALYEHKVYTQSVIWNINPFDQPGVESTKQKQKAQSAEGLSFLLS